MYMYMYVYHSGVEAWLAIGRLMMVPRIRQGINCYYCYCYYYYYYYYYIFMYIFLVYLMTLVPGWLIFVTFAYIIIFIYQMRFS